MKEKATSLTAVGTAILSSTCCVLPLILIFTSLGGGTLSAFYRENNSLLNNYVSPILSVVTVMFLGFAFYLAYFRKNKNCEDDSGSCPTKGASRGTKITLWISTTIALIFMLFPYYSEYVLPN